MDVLFAWDHDDPLARAKGESRKANAALGDYARMGAGRSLRALVALYVDRANSDPLARPPSKHVRTIFNWSARYAWVKRTARWEELGRERADQVWAARRQQVRERDWDHAEALRDLAQQMLDLGPSFLKRRVTKGRTGTPTVVDQAGKVVTEGTPAEKIVTVALNGQFLVQAEKLASDLARLAAEMATERPQVTVTRVIGGISPEDI